MQEIIVDGIPVLIKERERPPRTIRIRMKKRGKPFIRDLPSSKLAARPKQALQNFVDLGCDPKKKKEAAEDAGFLSGHGASVRAMDRILERRSIVNKIEEKCEEKHKKGADEKVAEVLVEQLDAIHPLAKGEKTDNLAVLSAAKEINKIKDNYPSKKIDIREMGFHLHFTPGDVEAAKQFKAITQVEADEAT